MKKRIVEIAVKVVVAALTAFLTAITTTSCLGHAPIILQTKSLLNQIPAGVNSLTGIFIGKVTLPYMYTVGERCLSLRSGTD